MEEGGGYRLNPIWIQAMRDDIQKLKAKEKDEAAMGGVVKR